MAAILTPQSELTYLTFPIEKTEQTPDGDLVVYGKATDGSVDSDEQIVDPDWAAKAVQDWLATGANVRVQHNSQRDPAGVGIEADTDADGATWVKSLVVEPVAKRLVEKGALRAYSVGIARPKIVRDSVARGGRIVDGSLVELSLVDRPANKNCTLQLVKADAEGRAEWVGKMLGDSGLLAKAAEVSPAGDVDLTLPADVSVSFTPGDLAKLMEHRRTAEKRQMDPDVGGGVDRDKIPAEDFAGRNRSFPIVTPGDVSDAASSIGRAGADNYGSDELKRRIISIARRKGSSFVAELPQSWKDDMGTKAEKAGKEPFGGKKAPPFDEDGKPAEDDDAKDSSADGDGDKADMEEPDATKKPKKKGKKKAKAADAAKSGRPTPGDAVTGEHTAPVPEHREPDGVAVEAFEQDAHLMDGDEEMKAATRLKSLGVSSGLGALHDLTCAAYHPQAADQAHPHASLTGIDLAEWQAKALDAAVGAPLQEAMSATQLWQHAVTIKSTEAETLTDLRWEAHKAFRDANPGPGAFPQPTELTPGRFRRPFISAGHAVPGTDYGSPHSATVPTRHVEAGQFDRGFLTDGQAAQSPSNKADSNAVIAAPVPTGSPQRTYYRTTQRDAARSAMQAMHDHIASTFPDLCPMQGPGVGGEPPVGARPVPVPAGASKAEKAAKKAADLEKKAAKLRARAGIEKAAGVPVAEALDVARVLEEMRAELAGELQTVTKALAEERQRTEELKAAVDALGDLPDPSTAPFKGVAQPLVSTKSSGLPEGARTVAETAERSQLAVMRELDLQFRTSPDPAQREAAWSALNKMRGLS